MGGRPFLVVFERVLFHLLSVGTDDDELDEDHCPSASSKSQHKKKKKSHSSRILSTSSVRSAKRVRLADDVAGVIPRPPTLMDSLGEEYDPPTVFASRTLENRYSSLRLVVRNVLSRSGLYEGSGTRDTPFEVALGFVLVTGSGPGPGVGSSTDGDVFVCEGAVETPAQESDIASLLPDELSRHTRTQHGRVAVGLEHSVIHNEWERGGFPCSCFCLLFDRYFLLGFEICSCLVVFVLSRFGILRCLILAGLKSGPTGSPVVM